MSGPQIQIKISKNLILSFISSVKLPIVGRLGRYVGTIKKG